MAAPVVLGGCNFYPTYGASRGVTKQGQDTFRLYSGMMTTGIIVGGAVFLLILWTVLRYRRRSDEMPRQFHENVPIEVIYTVVPILIVAVLFLFTVLTENNVDAIVTPGANFTSTGAPVVEITVTAFQWGWRFDYPRLDVGVAGETTNGPNNHGPQMVVPVGQTVQITLVSDDVIHGFYLRDFNFSRVRASPGLSTSSTSTCSTRAPTTASAPRSAGCTIPRCCSACGRSVRSPSTSGPPPRCWPGTPSSAAAPRPPTTRHADTTLYPSDALPSPSSAKGSA